MVLKRSGPFEKALAAFHPNPSLPYLPSKGLVWGSNAGMRMRSTRMASPLATFPDVMPGLVLKYQALHSA